MRKAIIVSVVFMLLLAGGCRKKVPDQPEEKKYIEWEYEYESDRENQPGDFPKILNVDGKQYELVDLSDVRYSTQQIKEYVEGECEIILGDLSELLDEYDFLINGNQYRLQRQQQQLEEAEVEITRSSEVIYHNIVGDLNGSDVKAKTAVSGYINGVLEQIELPLVRIDRITKPHWIDDLEIVGFFEGDEHTEYFQLPNGEELSIHQESPVWPGYQHDILVQKGLAEQYYQITEGRWVSDYQPEGDHHVRKALYSGKRLVCDFRAVYQLTYKTRGYKGKVICRSDADAVNAPAADRKRSYIIKAIVRYRLVESR